MKRTHGLLKKYRERIIQIGSGLSLLAVVNWLYNYPLWIFVIEWLGPVHGWFYLTLGVIAINRGLLMLHGITQNDWTGLDIIENHIKKMIMAAYFREITTDRIVKLNCFYLLCLEQLATWRKSFTFLLLSIFQDSFWAVAYLRSSNGTRTSLYFSKRDWIIFLVSSGIGSAYWTIRQFSLWELTKYSVSYFL